MVTAEKICKRKEKKCQIEARAGAVGPVVHGDVSGFYVSVKKPCRHAEQDSEMAQVTL